MRTPRDDFRAHWLKQVARGVCPHSGETIAECKQIDLCDCLDVRADDARKTRAELGALFDEAYPDD